MAGLVDPQYVDADTGVSYEHEPVVRRKPCAPGTGRAQHAPPPDKRDRSKREIIPLVPAIPGQQSKARQPQFADPATGRSYEHEPVVVRKRQPQRSPDNTLPRLSELTTMFGGPDSPSDSFFGEQSPDFTKWPPGPPSARSPARPQITPSPRSPVRRGRDNQDFEVAMAGRADPQYVDPDTGISYEHEPVVRRKPCAPGTGRAQHAPPPDKRDRSKREIIQLVPPIPGQQSKARQPQFVDPATGRSYEHEPVVMRKRQPLKSPDNTLPRLSELITMFDGPDSPSDTSFGEQSPDFTKWGPPSARSPARPQNPPSPRTPVRPQDPPAPRMFQTPRPDYIDPATGKSYEDEPVVMRKKKPPQPPSPPRPPSEYPDDESVAELSFHMDERFASERIVSLNESNFAPYIKQKEKALVYFYHMQQPANRKLEDEFSDAAEKSVNCHYGYGSVNCFREPWLCNLQKTMQKTPMIKLFSNGYELSNIDRAGEMNADQMNMLMKMTPILNQPRVDIGKKLQSEAKEDTPKKKRPFFVCQ